MCKYIRTYVNTTHTHTYVNTTHTHTWTGGGHDEYGAWRAAVFGCGRGTVRGCFEHHVRCVIAVNASRVAWMGMSYVETYKYMCAYVHVYVYTHTCRHTYVSLPLTTSVWSSKWVCYTSEYICMCTCLCTYIRTYICVVAVNPFRVVWMCQISICMNMFAYMYVYVYIHRCTICIPPLTNPILPTQYWFNVWWLPTPPWL